MEAGTTLWNLDPGGRVRLKGFLRGSVRLIQRLRRPLARIAGWGSPEARAGRSLREQLGGCANMRPEGSWRCWGLGGRRTKSRGFFFCSFLSDERPEWEVCGRGLQVQEQEEATRVTEP